MHLKPARSILPKSLHTNNNIFLFKAEKKTATGIVFSVAVFIIRFNKQAYKCLIENDLFNGNRFCKVTGLVNVTTPEHSNMIRQQLQWDGCN